MNVKMIAFISFISLFSIFFFFYVCLGCFIYNIGVIYLYLKRKENTKEKKTIFMSEKKR